MGDAGPRTGDPGQGDPGQGDPGQSDPGKRDPGRADPGKGDEAPGLRCDFCGERVPRVRRIALDRGYDRLQAPHAVRYACPRCSEEKERRRLGLARG
jgi:hypothetical protein